MRLFMVLVNLLIVVLAAWGLDQSHRHYVERAQATTQNLAQVLEQNVKGTLRQIDLVLLAIQEEVQRVPQGLQDGSLESFVQIRLARLGFLDALRVADREGRIRHGAPARAQAPVDGRDFFLRLKLDPQAGLVISRPARDGAEGAWAITVARRIDGPKGKFLGVVCATLSTDQLARAMSLVDVGRWGSVSLRGEDHSLLVRYPNFLGQDQLVGDTRIAGEYLAAVQAPSATAQFTAASTVDGQRRTYTLRKIDSPRFLILVGLAETEYLRAWRHEALFAGLATAGLIGLSLGMGWLARAGWLRQLADQKRLALQEAKYRLLAENAPDVIWTSNEEGHLTYISPSVLRQRGWTPEEFMTLDLDARVHNAQGAERIRARLAQAQDLPPGSQPFEEDALEVGVRHRDGHEILVEVRSRIVWDAEGRVAGLQGVSRDVTERRRIEAERDKLIQDLTQALGEVKALSGLLPICSHCKKVRDDQGYWNQIEAYLCEHTDATFTHGVCPECATAMRQELQARREQKGEG
jgi:PAS domain S-box-containing protein